MEVKVVSQEMSDKGKWLAAIGRLGARSREDVSRSAGNFIVRTWWLQHGTHRHDIDHWPEIEKEASPRALSISIRIV